MSIKKQLIAIMLVGVAELSQANPELAAHAQAGVDHFAVKTFDATNPTNNTKAADGLSNTQNKPSIEPIKTEGIPVTNNSKEFVTPHQVIDLNTPSEKLFGQIKNLPENMISAIQFSATLAQDRNITLTLSPEESIFASRAINHPSLIAAIGLKNQKSELTVGTKTSGDIDYNSTSLASLIMVHEAVHSLQYQHRSAFYLEQNPYENLEANYKRVRGENQADLVAVMYLSQEAQKNPDNFSYYQQGIENFLALRSISGASHNNDNTLKNFVNDYFYGTKKSDLVGKSPTELIDLSKGFLNNQNYQKTILEFKDEAGSDRFSEPAYEGDHKNIVISDKSKHITANRILNAYDILENPTIYPIVKEKAVHDLGIINKSMFIHKSLLQVPTELETYLTKTIDYPEIEIAPKSQNAQADIEKMFESADGYSKSIMARVMEKRVKEAVLKRKF